MEFWLQVTIALIVGAAFLVLAEFRLSGEQRHFWAMILGIYSLTLAFLFTFLFDTRIILVETRNYMDEVKSNIHEQLRHGYLHPGVGLLWKDIDTTILDKNDPLVHESLQDELNELKSDLEEGYVPIAHGREATVLAKIVDHAITSALNGDQPYVLATNFGSTEKYFGEWASWYQGQHEKLLNHEVPIVRFFVQRDALSMDEDYIAKVKEIHETFPTTLTGVISCACPEYTLCGLAGVPRDVLVLSDAQRPDNAIMLEEQFNVQGTRTRVRVTQHADRIKEARSSLDAGWACTTNESSEMIRLLVISEEDAKKYDKYAESVDLSPHEDEWIINLVEKLIRKRP